MEPLGEAIWAAMDRYTTVAQGVVELLTQCLEGRRGLMGDDKLAHKSR